LKRPSKAIAFEPSRETQLTAPSSDRQRWAAAGIFLLAFLLRIYGIWNADHSDEYNEVFEALRVCSGHLNLERWAKRFYLYVLSVEYGSFYLLGRLFHMFSSPMDFAANVVRDLSPLLLLGRTTSAFLGAASVFLTCRIATVLGWSGAGLLAALFFCLNTAHIEVAHFARVDATLGFLVLLSFSFIAAILRQGPSSRTRDYMLAGLFAGIAFQTKAPAIVLVIPLLFAHFTGKASLQFREILLDKKLLCCALFFILGLVIGNPAVLAAPRKFLLHLLGMGKVYVTPINETQSEHIGFVAYIIYFYREMGWALSLLAFYSLCRATLSRSKEEILLLSFMLPFYLIMGASRFLVSPSYMVPFMPFLYLLCARHLMVSIVAWPMYPAARRALALFLCTVLLLQPAHNVWRLELSFSGKNTRLLAKEWIEANIPSGSKILMDSGKSINSFAPAIAENRESLQRTLAEKERALRDGTLLDPTRIVDEHALIYYELLLRTVPELSYDITSTQFGLQVEPVDFYLRNGYEYFVISQEMKTSRSTEFVARRHPKAAAFYRSLDRDSRLQLIQVIRPTAKNRGDTFLIYKVTG